MPLDRCSLVLLASCGVHDCKDNDDDDADEEKWVSRAGKDGGVEVVLWVVAGLATASSSAIFSRRKGPSSVLLHESVSTC